MLEIKKNYLTLVIIGIILVVVAVYTWSTIKSNQAVTVEETPASKFLNNTVDSSPYTDLNGNKLNLTESDDKILIVTSWASWCPTCLQQLQDLSDISDKFGSDVRIIAINRAEPLGVAKNFLQVKNVSKNIELVLDPDDKYFKSIEGYNMPETLIFNTDGDIILHKRGKVTKPEIVTYVEAETKESN